MKSTDVGKILNHWEDNDIPIEEPDFELLGEAANSITEEVRDEISALAVADAIEEQENLIKEQENLIKDYLTAGPHPELVNIGVSAKEFKKANAEKRKEWAKEYLSKYFEDKPLLEYSEVEHEKYIHIDRLTDKNAKDKKRHGTKLENGSEEYRALQMDIERFFSDDSGERLPEAALDSFIDVLAMENGFTLVRDFKNDVRNYYMEHGREFSTKFTPDNFRDSGAGRFMKDILHLDGDYYVVIGYLLLSSIMLRAYKSDDGEFVKQDGMFVIYGPQGKGKTTFVKNLIWINELRSVFTKLDFNDTNILMGISKTLVNEIAELGAISDKDIDTVKSFLTKDVYEYRAPYRRDPERHILDNTFIATTNRRMVLNDQTGNRRFLMIDAPNKDIAANKMTAEYMKSLYAEIVYRWRYQWNKETNLTIRGMAEQLGMSEDEVDAVESKAEELRNAHSVRNRSVEIINDILTTEWGYKGNNTEVGRIKMTDDLVYYNDKKKLVGINTVYIAKEIDRAIKQENTPTSKALYREFKDTWDEDVDTALSEAGFEPIRILAQRLNRKENDVAGSAGFKRRSGWYGKSSYLKENIKGY